MDYFKTIWPRVLTLACLLCAVSVTEATNAAEISSGASGSINFIFVTGEIGPDDDKAFIRTAAGLRDATVVLDSSGGATIPAINIGKIIRKRGFSTIVLKNNVCLSACAMIWLGGAKRGLHPKASLGFHASYTEKEGKQIESGAANALVGAYYNSLGLSDMAIMFLTLAPPEDIQLLDAETAAILGIAVEGFGGKQTTSAGVSVLRRTDFYGYDYKRIDDTSMYRCKRRCEADGICMAFTFNEKHSVCFLKSDAGIGLHNEIAISGYKQTVKDNIYLSNMSILEDLDLLGGDYRDFRGSFSDCFRACSKERRCSSFSWVKRNKSCWLKDGLTEEEPNDEITSGTKVRTVQPDTTSYGELPTTQ